MKKLGLLLMILIVVLFGCSKENNKTEQDNSSNSLEIIEVSIQMPEKIKLNEEATIQALVTQGKDKVDDANEVKFEIGKAGQVENESIKAQNDGDGLYTIKKTFTENGKYVVTAHITARSMHSMPKKEFTVGAEDMGQEAETSKDTNQESTHEDGHGDQHSHHESNVEIAFNEADQFETNKEVTLKAILKQHNAPFEGAKVKFEIISENSTKSEWLNAKEDEIGIYSALSTFNNPGTFHVQIHVNKGEIHDHKVVMITVK